MFKYLRNQLARTNFFTFILKIFKKSRHYLASDTECKPGVTFTETMGIRSMNARGGQFFAPLETSWMHARHARENEFMTFLIEDTLIHFDEFIISKKLLEAI